MRYPSCWPPRLDGCRATRGSGRCRRRSFAAGGFGARPLRHLEEGHLTTEGGQTPCRLALDEGLQSHPDERRFFRLTGVFTGLTQQVVVDIQGRSHAYTDAQFGCRVKGRGDEEG